LATKAKEKLSFMLRIENNGKACFKKAGDSPIRRRIWQDKSALCTYLHQVTVKLILDRYGL
jgi:hypothetical protein